MVVMFRVSFFISILCVLLPVTHACADGLEIRSGLYLFEVADESEMTVGLTFSKDEIVDLDIGTTLGYDLKLQSSLGDYGDFDGPALGLRLWPSLKHDLNDDGSLSLKLGPEFIATSVGDDIGGSYTGIGGKIALEQVRDSSFLQIGFGFNSGDTEDYFDGFESGDDVRTLDLVYALKSGDLSYGLDLQMLSADFGPDFEFTGLFVSTQW